MLIAVPDLLSPAEVADIRAIIDAAEWIDGNATSGHQSALAKHNEQLPEDGDAAKQAGRNRTCVYRPRVAPVAKDIAASA